MTLSNQYPRMPWERNPEPVHGGFIARPTEAGGQARVYYDRVQLGYGGEHQVTYWWVWTVGWTDRFADHGIVSADTNAQGKQLAADMATTRYWDLIEETAGWVAPAAAPPEPVDLVAWHFKVRFEDWLWNRATLDEVRFHQGRYLNARRARPIISEEVDDLLRVRLTDAFANRLNFGFGPNRPVGTRGYLAQLRLRRAESNAAI